MSVPQWASEGFTLYVSHMFKHVPEKMVFAVFRDMGLGMLQKGGGAISFREYADRKSAKISFRFLFTRGNDAERNLEILRHLREGGEDAHFQVTYQKARKNPKTGRDDPDRFWKAPLWREKPRRSEDRPEKSIEVPEIVLSGGALGKDKKHVKRRIKLVKSSDKPNVTGIKKRLVISRR